jgi:hypothetical protein
MPDRVINEDINEKHREEAVKTAEWIAEMTGNAFFKMSTVNTVKLAAELKNIRKFIQSNHI